MIDTIKVKKTGHLCTHRFVSIIITALFVVLISTSVSSAQQQTIVFYLDKNYHPIVDLEGLQPLTEGMKAILAMYALQVGGGCQGSDKSGLRCVLTTELGLGAQCSPEHLILVNSWFTRNMPNMTWYSTPSIKSSIESRDLQSICYHTPEGAREQQTWEIIRVKRNNNLVYIDAIGARTVSASDGPIVHKRYKSVYRIGHHDVSIVSHEEVSPKKGKTK